MKNVLLACGSIAVNTKFATALQDTREYTIIHGALCGREVMQQLAEYDIDIAVLHLNLCKIDGLTIHKLIKDFEWHTKVIIVNLNSDIDTMRRVLAHGVQGYLSCIDKEEIEWCLDAVKDGERYVDTALYHAHYFSKRG